MRTLTLSKSGYNKIRSLQRELKASDLEDSIKPIPPGEWCLLKFEKSLWVGFVNPLVEEKFAAAHVLEEVSSETEFLAEEFIKKKIQSAINLRKSYQGYEEGCRIFYGVVDGLPGLIVDHFTNATIVQINTAGIDRHRDLISLVLTEALKTKTYFLDNPKYREKEQLPQFSREALPDLVVRENDLTYELRSEVIQKVGFYYDHRENRRALADILGRLSKKPKRGLDLFSYAGAWGLNSLKAGVEKVDFVDQGDFSQDILKVLATNGFSDRGFFHRGDVFKFLDEAAREEPFDLIMCDPPAFAKSSKQKAQALEGYSKLHRKVFKAASPDAILVFSSCTHYVSHDEFQKNILDAAFKEGKKLQLLFCGIQGWDHPVKSLSEKSNYIKSYIYRLEPK